MSDELLPCTYLTRGVAMVPCGSTDETELVIVNLAGMKLPVCREHRAILRVSEHMNWGWLMRMVSR